MNLNLPTLVRIKHPRNVAPSLIFGILVVSSVHTFTSYLLPFVKDCLQPSI